MTNTKRWLYSQKLRAMHRRKPRPEKQLHLDIVIGSAQKVSRLLHLARHKVGEEAKRTWSAFYDALDEYHYRKNYFLQQYVPDALLETVKFPHRYQHQDDAPEPDKPPSPNGSDYDE